MDNYNRGRCGVGYTLTGDFTQGDPTYDAARANMGEPWMVPTKDQCQELIDNTTSIWAGTGRRFINKTDSSKYIFIFAAGVYYLTNIDCVNSDGYYWTTGYHDSIYAYYLYTRSNYYGLSKDYKDRGRSIRPVRPNTW